MPDASPQKLYCTRCLTTFEGDPTQCPNLACRRKKPRDGWGRIYRQGEVFDRNYKIHKMLAVGGAGVTYVARELGPEDTEIGPKLAVKVLLAARDQGPYVRRLATEAQIIQELDHPNIVQYLGFVHRAGHSPYLITHFEEGGSLLDHMRRVGTLPVRAACTVGRQICWALEKAHERGIVHRDLKPENVLLARPVSLEEEPLVRVADFGIAKVQGSLGGGLTRVGAFVGTPHYAAPEQFVGGAVSEAADVYAVGALMYFTMMARHVVRFADRLDPEDSFQLLCDNLPPQVVRDQDSAVDVQRINLILSVAMRVDPSQRCTVTELDAMLEALLADTDPTPPERLTHLPTSDLPDERHGMSVLGVASAVEDNRTLEPATLPSRPVGSPSEAPAPAPVAEAPAPAGLSGAALAAGAVAVGAVAAGAVAAGLSASRKGGTKGTLPVAPAPSSSATLEPSGAPAAASASPSAAPAPAPPASATHGGTVTPATVPDAPAPAPAPAEAPAPAGRGRVLLFAAALAVSGVAAVGGAVAAVTLNPDLLTEIEQQLGGGPERLSSGSDYAAIKRSVVNRKDQLGTMCAVPAGTTVRVQLTVDSSGSVQSAKALRGGDKGACVADRLARSTVQRSGRGLVQVELGLKW